MDQTLTRCKNVLFVMEIKKQKIVIESRHEDECNQNSNHSSDSKCVEMSEQSSSSGSRGGPGRAAGVLAPIWFLSF